jgi:hypothetical protein
MLALAPLEKSATHANKISYAVMTMIRGPDQGHLVSASTSRSESECHASAMPVLM